MNSFHYDARSHALSAEQLPLQQIAEQFGTPCFVYSRAALTQAWQAFAQACAGRDALVCYAVKANSNLALLNLFARLGAGFDIVSGGELARVLAAGGDNFYRYGFFQASRKPGRLPPGHVRRQFGGR